jgi:hypothetical protein
MKKKAITGESHDGLAANSAQLGESHDGIIALQSNRLLGAVRDYDPSVGWMCSSKVKLHMDDTTRYV